MEMRIGVDVGVDKGSHEALNFFPAQLASAQVQE